MKRFVLAMVMALGMAGLASAQQVVSLHGAPQGVTSCTLPSSVTPHTIGTGLCPMISFQFHWKPGDGGMIMPNTLVPGLAHTHIECNLPHLGEFNAPFTVPCRFQLFHTAGKLALIYDLGLVSQFAFDNPAQTFPIVGDPMGVVVVPFHLTFDPTRVSMTQLVQPHGWFNMTFAERTVYDQGDVVDGQMMFTGWSTRDPSVAPGPEGEGTRIMLAAKAIVQGYTFGAHLMEFRSPLVPMWAPLTAPVKYLDFSYSYGANTALTGDNGLYTNSYDNDYHNGVLGNVVETIVASSIGGFGSSQIVTEDPAVISKFTAPAGFSSGTHRHTTAWETHTDPTQDIIGQGDHVITHGEILVALLSFDEAIASNAVGCVDASCSNAVTDIDAPPPPVVAPLPPPPPPAPMWHLIQPQFFRLNDMIRICDTDGKCLTLGSVQE